MCCPNFLSQLIIHCLWVSVPRKTENTIMHCRVCNAAGELVEDCDHECLFAWSALTKVAIKRNASQRRIAKGMGRKAW